MKDKGCPWYPFYVGDYARKTAHLSLLEHGAYRLLMDHYYATRSPLPAEPSKLYRICRARTPSERKSVLLTATEFFVKDGTLLRNEKCDSEIAKMLNYSDSQSAKAKLRHSRGSAAAYARARASSTTTTTSTVEGDKSPHPLSTFKLPEWVPEKDWEDFSVMRKRIRKPMTERAKELIVLELDKLRAAGNDPGAVLRQSVSGSYQGVFELKNRPAARHGKFEQQDYDKGTGGFDVTKA